MEGKDNRGYLITKHIKGMAVASLKEHPPIACKYLGRPLECSDRTADNVADIRTGHFSNASLERYRYNLLSNAVSTVQVM